MTTHCFDAVVVGAGPAGSASAAFLAERGFSVALLERAAFPRPKTCAEYLSPEASRVLDRLIPADTLAVQQPGRLYGTSITSPDGTRFTGRFRGAHRYRGFTDYGVALPRDVLDHLLAQAAVARGVTLFEHTTVTGMADARNGSVGLVTRQHGELNAISGRLIVGADGMNSRIARLLGLARRGRRKRLAFVAHAAGVADIGSMGEIFVRPGGYAGLTPVGRGLTNISVVIDLKRGQQTEPKEAWFRTLLGQHPAVQQRLAGARFVDRVRAVGPFAYRTRRATADRVLLVGDAADFYDPFTGEGIYAALHGAELVAEHAARGLEADRLLAADLHPYDTARRHAFGGKWMVERLVSWAVAHPAMFNRMAHRLAEHPELADLLVGVTGDFVPPSEVLRPTFMWQLVW